MNLETTHMSPRSRYKWYGRTLPITPQKALMIEDFIGNQMSIYDVAIKHKVSYDIVCVAITAYFKKPKYTVTLPSKV
jgi:hypothetical protein